MKLMPGTTLLTAKVKLLLERWAIADAERAAGARSTPRPVLRACTRLCAAYGAIPARELIERLRPHLLNSARINPDTGELVIDRRDLDNFICLAAKLSRRGALSREQVQRIIERKIDAMVALPLSKGISRG